MKIIELTLKNLNSLQGEWHIDFAHPEYSSNGIFALTGPTGAGKSTILDAICLALYGRTPRLDRITKSTNEIMSRQTGECFVEVVFESQTGRFRCRWDQRRSRKKIDGALQDPEHQIANADDGSIIESKRSLVKGVIEEKTGMDFDRFTRSILLAQGGFDTFLKADSEQKSKILEQITGTAIYSEISLTVHNRRRDEKEKLSILEAETSGISILETTQEKDIQLKLDDYTKQEKEITDKISQLGNAITWLKGIDDLKEEIDKLNEEAEKINVHIEAFKPERNKLELAFKAATLDGTYATLTSLRKQHNDDENALKTSQEIIPELEAKSKAHTINLKNAESETNKAKSALKDSAPTIKKIRSLDQNIAEQEKNLSAHSEQCKKEREKIESNKQAVITQQEKRIKTDKFLTTIEKQLNEHQSDEWLIGGFAGVELMISNLVSKHAELNKKDTELCSAKSELKKVANTLKERSKHCATSKKNLEMADEKLRLNKKSIDDLLAGKLLREYRTEKDTLLREMAFIKKIEELEDHRHKLENGKPCPLCGSETHPFAKGNIPIPDETEKKIEKLENLIAKADELEENNNKLKENITNHRTTLHNSEKLESRAKSESQIAEKTLNELSADLKKLRVEYNQLKSSVTDKLDPLGIKEIDEANITSLIKTLKSRLTNWQEWTKKKIDTEKTIVEIDSELKRLEAIIKTHNTLLHDKEEALKFLKEEYTANINERKKIYGNKNVEHEEAILLKAITNAEEIEKNARDANTSAQQKSTTAIAQVKSLVDRIEKRLPELKASESEFILSLSSLNLKDETHFIESRLTTHERAALESKAKKLDNTQAEIKAQQKNRNARLNAETSKKVTDKKLVELEPQHNELEKTLKELREETAQLKLKLSENHKAKELIRDKKASIEAQKKEFQRWDKLHTLIGSSDGKKYRNFAQGLTFELMVSHANKQLEKMTDRYLLIRSEEEPLVLNVIDNYQGGEIRSTKNLSGGESFIVSLTLALGLSKMASRKVRVDSLFLDEGFGTLDEEALETALETLSGLHEDGKLIGIISHVAALKERISTQISITPMSGGKSKISGPGCSAVKAAVAKRTVRP